MLNDILLQDHITAATQAFINKQKETTMKQQPETMIIEHHHTEKRIILCHCGHGFEAEEGDITFCPKCGTTLNCDYTEHY